MAGLNKAAKIDAEKSTQESSAVSAFIQQAPLKADVEAKVPQVEKAEQKSKNSPWREGALMSEDELRSTDKRFSGFLNMELQLRLQFIKSRMNNEALSQGKKATRISINELQAMAVEDYTNRILKKWGYDL